MNSAGTDTGSDSTSASAADVRAEPLFIDTGAFFAYYNERDEHHETARTTFQAIRTGDLAYAPLYTTRFVLTELVTLLLYKVGHTTATRALGDILSAGSFNVVRADPVVFADACDELDRYDDHEITLVDHLTGVLADERAVECIFAFDSDFATLGFTRVPVDTGEPTE